MAKKGIMEEKACSAINWLLVNIANPALVISSSIGNVIEKEELLFTLLLAAGLYLVVLLLAWLVIPLFHASKKEAGVYKCLIVFGNIGFMGFPMISVVYGAQALIYDAGGLLCDAGNAVRDNGFHDGAGMWRRIYDGVERRYPDNGIVDLDDAIAICFTENVILLLRIYMVMNESKIIERRMQVCAQQQLIRQKIFISDVHWIMNFPMEMRSC